MSKVAKTPLKHLEDGHMHLSQVAHAEAHNLTSDDGSLRIADSGGDYSESIETVLEPKKKSTESKDILDIKESQTAFEENWKYQDYVDSGKYNPGQLDLIKKRLASYEETLKYTSSKSGTDAEIIGLDNNLHPVFNYAGNSELIKQNNVEDFIAVDPKAYLTDWDVPMYSKHHGLEELMTDMRPVKYGGDGTSWTDEEDVVKLLNDFYTDKGVDVRFAEANPGHIGNWLTTRTSWDAIEVLIGDEQEGEGYIIELNPKINGDWAGIYSKVRSHIDLNMGNQYYKLEGDDLIEVTDDVYDQVLDILNPGDLFLDDNSINKARFAHRGDQIQGLVNNEDGTGLIQWNVQTGVGHDGVGDRLKSRNKLEQAIEGTNKFFDYNNPDVLYNADMDGGITLTTGQFLPYQWIWDNRDKIVQRGLKLKGIEMTTEKIAQFGSEEALDNYIAENAHIYFVEDEQEYWKLKNELNQVRLGKKEGDIESLSNQLTTIATAKGWTPLYDENGTFIDIKRNEEDDDDDKAKIESDAQDLASNPKNDFETLTYLRQQSLIKLETLAGIAHQNIEQVGEEMSWYENIGGFFDFSEDSYDNDKANLKQVVEGGDIFASDNILTNLPGSSNIKEEFNKELLNFKTLSRALDLNINVALNPEENFWAETVDNLSRTLTGDDLFGTIEDESRDAFEGVLEQEGYVVDKLGEHVPWTFWSRRTAETTSQVATDLAPLLIELYVFKKAGGLKRINKTLNSLTGVLTKGNKSKTWAKIINKLVVPSVATTVEWTAAELMGERIMGGGAGTWDAHTFNTTTGETNFTMPMVMGSMGVIYNRISKGLYNGFSKTRIGSKILPRVTNPEGFLHASRKVGMNFVGTGTTGAAMLMVAETAQAITDDLIKEGKIREAKEFKEIWNVEHFITTAMALSVLSARKVAPEAVDAFRTDVLHLRGKTKESNAAAKYFKTKEGIEDSKIDKILETKIKEVKENKKLNKKEKNKKIAEAKDHAKHLKLFNEIKIIKEDYKKKGKRSEYIKETWKDWEALKKDPSKLTVEQYERLSELSNNEVIELLRRNKVDIDGKSGKFYQNVHEVVNGLSKTADYLELGKDSKERQIYLQNTIKTMVNKNQIDALKKQIKEENGSTTDLEIQLKKLKESNERLFEQNEGLYDGFQKKWNKMLKAEVNIAKHLANSLGGTVKQYNRKQWENFEYIDSKGKKRKLDKDADAAYIKTKDGMVLLLNMNVIKKTRNIGAPVHEVIHHILRNSLKDANGKMTKDGMNAIDVLVSKFTVREQKKIQKRIDDNYKYNRDKDGGIISEKAKEEYYEEYITSISDAIKNGEIKYRPRTMRNVGQVVYPWLKGAGMSELYKYDVNSTKSHKAGKDLYNLLGDVSAAQKVRAETIEGLKDIKGGIDVRTGEVVLSKSMYKEKIITEELGITKESTKKIVEKNKELSDKVLKENIRDKNGNVQASVEIQQKLVTNNLPAAFKLALKASNKAKDITLEEGLKYDDVMDWYSDYSIKLVDLARTYRAERTFDTKTKTEISPPEKVPFGAYMNKILPKKYSGILEAGKKKIQTKSISEEATAKKVGKIATKKTTKTEFDGKTIKLSERLGKNSKLIHNKVMDMVKSGDVKLFGLTNKNFTTLRNLVTPDVQRMFGIDPKSGTLSKPDIKNAQMFINKNVETLISMLPEGTNPSGKSTGVQKVLLDAFYTKGAPVKMAETGSKQGLPVQTKRTNITPTKFLEVFGITKRGEQNLYKKESNTSSRIHAIVKQTERMIVNQAVREQLIKDGNGLEAFSSHLGEGKSEVMYSKSVHRNVDVGKSTVLKFDGRKRKFHYEISVQGLSKESIRRSYDIVFGKDGLKDNYGENLRTGIVNDYVKILKPYAAKLETYKVVGEKMKMNIEEYLSIKDIAETGQAMAEHFGLKKPMQYYFNDPLQFERQKVFVRDISSSRLNRKLEGVVNAKEKQRISDQHIINEIRGKSSFADIKPTILGKSDRSNFMLFDVKDGFTKEYLAKHPGYENLIDYKIKTEKGKRRIELEFKGGKTRTVKLPESSKFDGKQEVSQEMVDNKVSSKEKKLRKENADFHWDRLIETYEISKELADGVTYSNVELAMLQAGLLGNMKTSIRAAALLKYVPVNAPTRLLKDSKGDRVWEFEHGIPAKNMALILINHFYKGNKIDLQKLKESYSVGVIHRDFNKNFGEVFQERMQFDYKIGDIPPKRWFNIWTAMGEAHVVRDIYTGKLYGEGQVNYWNKVKENHKQTVKNHNKSIQKVVGEKYSKSSKRETTKDLRTIEKAIKLGRSPNKENKGMSTWDFDDTLAYTKSGVRYTLPNPSGKPQPKKKVIFMAGGAGSGKSNVIKQLKLQEYGFKVVNQDISLEWLMENHGLPKDMRDFTKIQKSKFGLLTWKAAEIAKKKQTKYQGKGDGVVVDGTGANIKTMQSLVREFKNKGYDVGMVFVETSKDVAIARNKARKERSLRTFIVEKTWDAVMTNKEAFKVMFGKNFGEVKTDNLKQGDPMPLALTNVVHNYVGGYIKGRLNAGEFANKGAELQNKGAKFDFTEFDFVKEGTKGPFFQKALDRIKKFGPEHQYVLTARPPEAALAIHLWLERMGLKIPKENITALGNSTGEAKAMWMLKKFEEGYNDMYFADDALGNVKAVKDVLSQLDVKSKVQHVIKYSKSRSRLSQDFNKILEEVKGIGAEKTFSEAKGRLLGKKIWNIPIYKGWGAEDFAGLTTYAFAGKGKQGERHIKFFEDNLQKPFNRAYDDIHSRKQNISNDYKTLRKAMPEITKELNTKLSEYEGFNVDFTVDQAIRVHLWDKAGFKIPDLSKTDLKILTDFVRTDADLTLFADQLSQITMLKEGYIKPGEHWLGENITLDMNNVVDRVYRKEALSEFKENREAIFGKWEGGKLVGENMNKIESAYGPKHREALENILWRMEKGTNRTVGADSNTNKWMNWVNSATGTIMFFNQKSAALQTISTLNYVNGSFNNPMRAAQAFANQPQYWKDFAKIFNSDMLLQRRSGLKINVEASELIDRVGGSKDKASAALAYLLEKGFIPTKYADSFAIALGGATFYRNSVRKHLKNGMSKVEAEKQAWEDFTEMTEATQQSSRPDLISMQQASALGRPILAFANTPMQMYRRHKRRIQDIANNRGNMPENVASALYYGFAQTMIFSFLSNAMFAVDDESDDAFAEKKKTRHVQTILDSYLRGMGTGGAGVSALKNGIMRFFEEDKKDYNADYGNVVIDMLNVSPPIGSKARKIYSALKTWKHNKEVIPEMGLNLENPGVLATANIISAITNVPADRVVMKLQNIKDATNGDLETWQRVAMLMGWNRWTLGLDKRESVEKVKEEVKEVKKEKKKKKEKEIKEEKEINLEEENKKLQDQEIKDGKKKITCIAVTKGGNRCKTVIEAGSSYCTIHINVEKSESGKEVQCGKIKSNKKRCKMMTNSKSGYCYYHD